MATRPYDKIWFKAKRYGWGWTPCCWQGWLATSLYGVAFGGCVAWWLTHGRNEANPYLGLLPLFAITAAFLALCWTRGEKPRWQWGGKP